MASFLDIGLLSIFKTLFPFLLVFVLVFAILEKTEILGKGKRTLNAFLSVVLAFLTLLSQTVIDIINQMAPWFVFTVIFVVLLLLIYQTLGATEKDIASALKTDKTIQWSVFGIAIVILLLAVGAVVGETIGPYLAGETTAINETGVGVATPSWQKNLTATLFHPKVMGVVFIMLLAIFAIAFLAGSPEK